jgi:hypothetical protein
MLDFTELGISELSLSALEGAWQIVAENLRKQMNSKALLHWKEQWSLEASSVLQSTNRTHLTDAQRSRLRALARPAKGCKCGSKSHAFVNDLACPLYSNLRRLGKFEENVSNVEQSTISKSIQFQERKLKAVEAAFTERIVREREEKEKEAAEASFVDHAEKFQLRELGQAIFAPSLTTMTLSCIAALKDEFERVRASKEEVSGHSLPSEDLPSITTNKTKSPEPGSKPNEMDAHNDDDDDDVPLEELAKRSLSKQEIQPPKKRKADTAIVDFECLALMLRHLSKRWGHVYEEPNDVDYAWRWELFHGQMGTLNWDTSSKNPRKSFSLENVLFLLDDKTINSLRFIGEPKTPTQNEALTQLSFLIDPSRTGIIDELFALQQTGVVRMDSSGIPRLSSSWFKNVDVLVLEEMAACWCAEADPQGRYGIHETIKILATKWIKHDEGWALTSDPDDIVFETAEFATWRDAFETKHEETTDDAHGIGRFGI